VQEEQDKWERSVTAAEPVYAGNGTDSTEAQPTTNEDEGHQRPSKRTKTRAGFTTNKGHGRPKAKRRIAARSRRRNRVAG